MARAKKEKRKIDLLVLSDIHLGMYGCRAKELLNYLKSVQPKEIILNGDVIDIWQFSKRYWPKSHTKVLSHFFKLMSKGVKITYITGNHDELLRKFEGFSIGSFELQNKVSINLGEEKAWVFHGDIFDVTMQHSRWLTKLGAIGYDGLILINQLVNTVSNLFGWGRISFSKRIKNSVKGAVKFINQFEQVATDIAAENGYDYVICGHIHHPVIKTYNTKHGIIQYLNSGDWVENLSALEYNEGEWELYQYNDAEFDDEPSISDKLEDIGDLAEKSAKELFGKMLSEMHLKSDKP